MRICLVYDCLYPWTVGGAERWMRDLAEALADEGHDVSYLTRKQWPDDEPPAIPGVRVIAVSRQEPLYGPDGNRTIGEPIRFGLGVLRHLLCHRRAYDVVHASGFPYFSLLAAGVALRGTRARLVVDWFEVWSKDYWRRYLGGTKGWVGWRIQRRCARVPQQAFVFSRLHGRRLVDEGLRSEPITHAGLYAGPIVESSPEAAAAPRDPLVVFAGRHIAEKRAPAIPPAIAAARERVPGLRGLILGDGPQLEQVRAAIAAADMEDVVEAPGFVDRDDVRDALARATCLLLPSEREGYGLVVVEAAAVGTPSVVVAGEDNAAVELVTDGVNGVIARSAAPSDLADAIVRVHESPGGLRASTTRWFAENAERLSLRHSLETVTASYAEVERQR